MDPLYFISTVGAVIELSWRLFQSISRRNEEFDDLQRELSDLHSTAEVLREIIWTKQLANTDRLDPAWSAIRNTLYLTTGSLESLEQCLEPLIRSSERWGARIRVKVFAFSKAKERAKLQALEKSIHSRRVELQSAIIALTTLSRRAVAGGDTQASADKAQELCITVMGVAGAGKSTLSEATSQEDMIDVDEDLKSRKLPDKVSPHPKSLCSGFNTPFCGYKRCWKNQMNDSFKRLGRPKSFAQSSSKRAVVWHLLKWPAIGVGAVSSTVINSYYSSTQFSRDSASPWGKHPPNRDWISGGAVWYCRPRSNGRADSGGLSRVVSLGYMSLHGLQKWTQPLNDRFSDLLRDPSPSLFLAALFAYGLATLSYYSLHTSDRYQDIFLIGGGIIGTAAGYFGGGDVQGILLRFMPWSILLSLILSSWVHWVVRRRWARNVADENIILDEKDNSSDDEEKGTTMF